MTTDELREKIARTLDYLHDPWPGGIDAHWEQGQRADGYRMDADAILPIVEAEVRRVQAEALREAATSIDVEQIADEWSQGPGSRDDMHWSAGNAATSVVLAIHARADQIEKETTR